MIQCFVNQNVHVYITQYMVVFFVKSSENTSCKCTELLPISVEGSSRRLMYVNYWTRTSMYSRIRFLFESWL